MASSCWKWQRKDKKKEKAMTNIHQNYRQDEAIHSRGREEKYHQYLTLFYGEATWFLPGSCAGDQQQSITIDKICVHGRPLHFVSLRPASVKLPPLRSQTQVLSECFIFLATVWHHYSEPASVKRILEKLCDMAMTFKMKEVLFSASTVM